MLHGTRGDRRISPQGTWQDRRQRALSEAPAQSDWSLLMSTNTVKIGLLLPQWHGGIVSEHPRGHDVIAAARLAEAVDLDSVWLVDHFYYEP